ncbi:hypothetical protein C8T65DRAFT_237566 [Cerioporus squamosus]|nr:hypothetical protein C8T65DRAFT_237566 [Cerioporus squamosus]
MLGASRLAEILTAVAGGDALSNWVERPRPRSESLTSSGEADDVAGLEQSKEEEDQQSAQDDDEPSTHDEDGEPSAHDEDGEPSAHDEDEQSRHRVAHGAEQARKIRTKHAATLSQSDSPGPTFPKPRTRPMYKPPSHDSDWDSPHTKSSAPPNITSERLPSFRAHPFRGVPGPVSHNRRLDPLASSHSHSDCEAPSHRRPQQFQRSPRGLQRRARPIQELDRREQVVDRDGSVAYDADTEQPTTAPRGAQRLRQSTSAQTPSAAEPAQPTRWVRTQIRGFSIEVPR